MNNLFEKRINIIKKMIYSKKKLVFFKKIFLSFYSHKRTNYLSPSLFIAN